MRVHTPNRLAAAIALALLPGLSHAQVMMEEVVVTAQKREQNVQDVGIAISAFSGEQMERLGYDSAQQVTSMAPGVSTVQPNGEANYAIAMRGVAASDFTTNVESPVALYLDEVYISQMSGAGFQLYDMDRVELLRGPQGTLYGRNATGGLAHYVSKKPTHEFEGYGKVTVADYDLYKYEGAVGGGLTDTLAVRFSGTYNQGDGYVNNRLNGKELNNTDDQSWRLHVLWEPSDDLSILVTGRKAEQSIDTGFFKNVSSMNPGEYTPDVPNTVTPGYVGVSEGYLDRSDDPWSGEYDRNGFNDLDTDGATLTIKWNLGWGNLTSITDRSNVHRHYIEDSDASPYPVFSFFLNTGAEQTTQELRLDGDADKLKWVAGLYYLKLDINDNNGGILADGFLGLPPTMPAPGDPALGIINPYERNMESYSGFGQLEYALNDQWTVIGGLRFTADENDYEYRSHVAVFLDPFAHDYDNSDNLQGAGAIGRYEGDRNDDEWSGRLQANYTPSDDLLLYGSLNRGIRGGGFNAPITLSLPYTDEVMSYEPEKLNSIEFGFKWTLLDGAARLNGATYYYDYQDYQAFYIVGIDTITFNTDADSTGGELEFVASPVEGLDLLLGTAYNDINVDIPSTLFGSPLANGGREAPSVQSPKWTFNAMARYGLQTDIGEIAFQADVLWRDEHYFALTGFETVRENGYSITNLSVSWTDPDQHWNVTGFLDNAFDEEYIVQTFDLSGPVLGMTEQYYGKPRWWGISARYNWGS